MKIDILTLFPEMFAGPFSESLLKRAQEDGRITLCIHNLRDWAIDKHKTVDDTPYGGGPGMVLKVDVIDRALATLLEASTSKAHIVLLTPQGTLLKQAIAQELATTYDHLILIAGHYEGFDDRVRQLVDQEISIGDYVLTGGELPAMVLTEAVVRLLPGVVGKQSSLEEESFSEQLLEYPHYTRPEKYTPQSRTELGELAVPDILLSGNHAKIVAWRKAQAEERTDIRRPDLKIKN